MASDTPITLGPITIGHWIWECETLKSKVELREKLPSFSVKLSAELALSALLGALPGIGLVLGPKATKLDLKFKGNIKIVISAEPMRISCIDTKQTVGYDFVIEVSGGSTVTAAGVTADIQGVLPLTIDGERRQCDCNKDVNLLSGGLIKTQLETLIPLPVSEQESFFANSSVTLDPIVPEHIMLNIEETSVTRKLSRRKKPGSHL